MLAQLSSFSASRFGLRIAIPSWRLRLPKRAAVPEPKALSAAGTRALFEKELSGELYDPVVSAEEAARLPEESPEIGSLKEQELLRAALYPDS